MAPDTPPSDALQAVSLGFACETKYQLSRHIYFRQHPDGDESDFRRMLMANDYGQRVFERHIFDWQITPFEALIRYLESDFQGVFERDDLAAAEGEVEHRTLRTRHPHDFHALDGVLDARAIDAQYAAARSKFDYLAQKFRRLMADETPKLYVFRQIRIYDDAVRLAQLLSVAGGGPAKLMFVGYDGEDQMLDALRGEVFKSWAPLRADKPDDRQWEGDDARWDAVLAPFKLILPGVRLPKTFDESLTPAAPVPAARGPRRFLASLFGRRRA